MMSKTAEGASLSVQGTVQCMIITLCCTQRWIPECVSLKAVIISKKMNNARKSFITTLF